MFVDPARRVRSEGVQICIEMTESLSHNQPSFLRTHKRHEPFCGRHLAFPVEKMEEGACINDVDPAVELCQGGGRIEDIGSDECTAESVAVEEEIVSNFHQATMEVRAIDVLGRRAVKDDFPDILPQATPHIEKMLPVLDTGHDLGIEE